MSLGMYKPGQGYWARVLTAASVLALAAGAAQWTASHWFHEDYQTKARVAVWAVAMGGALVALWIGLNRPRVVDFLIATETEMKKVDWPTTKTLVAMTGVVIASLLGLALLVAGIDTAFNFIFRLIHVL